MKLVHQGTLGASTYWMSDIGPMVVTNGKVRVAPGEEMLLGEFEVEYGPIEWVGLEAPDKPSTDRPPPHSPAVAAALAKRKRNARKARNENWRKSTEFKDEMRAFDRKNGLEVDRVRSATVGVAGVGLESQYEWLGGEAFPLRGHSPEVQPEDWVADMARGRGQGWNSRNRLNFRD